MPAPLPQPLTAPAGDIAGQDRAHCLPTCCSPWSDQWGLTANPLAQPQPLIPGTPLSGPSPPTRALRSGSCPHQNDGCRGVADLFCFELLAPPGCGGPSVPLSPPPIAARPDPPSLPSARGLGGASESPRSLAPPARSGRGAQRRARVCAHHPYCARASAAPLLPEPPPPQPEPGAGTGRGQQSLQGRGVSLQPSSPAPAERC